MQQPCYNDTSFSNSESNESDVYCVEQFFPENEGILHHFTKYGNLNGIENITFEEEYDDFAYEEDTRIIEVRGSEEEANFPPKILSWNRGEICSEIVKQVYIHRASEVYK